MTEQSSSKALPQVIFFDAMGTLFGLKSSVGEIYQRYAAKYHVIVDAEELNQAFISSFKKASPLAFSPSKVGDLKQQEFLWWSRVVSNTFEQLQINGEFSDFTVFFAEIYDYFATVEPWYIFPDTLKCLQKWQSLGVELGIISNFDSRLIGVLKALNLQQFFNSITISSQAGFAKPDAKIFTIALAKHQVLPGQAWHIGDSFIEDYQGAKKTGVTAFWLNRGRDSRNIGNELPNLSSLG